MKKLTLKEFQERIDKAHPEEKLKALNYNGDKKDCEVICLTCGTIYKKKSGNFVKKGIKSICKMCFPTHMGILKDTFSLPEDYEYIEPYRGMHKKVLIRHKTCGFIWGIKPNNIKYGKGCPKCSKKLSKGERKIIKWCEDNHLDYDFQVPIKISNHNLVIDFYLPTFDLYIEYNGEQHYHPVEHFGGEEKFLKQKELDFLKVNFLKEKLLVIPYTEFNNIENILYGSTTISKESTSKQMEAKNIQKEDEDIVSTSIEI